MRAARRPHRHRIVCGLGAVVVSMTATLAGPLGESAAAAGAPAASAQAAVQAAVAACQQAPTPGVAIPALAPRDPLITELGLDQAWALTTGAGVTVGIVDTGVDATSPKLAGAVDVGETLHVVDDPAVYAAAADGRSDCDGHGTEIAGIIAGRTAAGDDRVSGIAPAARIYPVQIQGEIAQAPSALIAAAIRIAAAHAQVLNLSFAQTTDDPGIRAAVAYAVAHDVVVVAAAANEGASAPSGSAARWYPAAYPSVLSVASVDADGMADSESTGSWIKIAAPGDSLTTVPRGGKGYVTVTGTSFATAIVSGTAALLRARFPALSAAEVITRLERTAVPPGDGSRDEQVGYGTVDPYAALTRAPGPSATAALRPGHVAVAPIRAGSGGASSDGVLGVTAALVALAALVGVATVSVRSGRRRGWYPGRRPRSVVDDRTPEAHPAELS